MRMGGGKWGRTNMRLVEKFKGCEYSPPPQKVAKTSHNMDILLCEYPHQPKDHHAIVNTMGTEKLWVNVVLKFLDNLYCSSLLFSLPC